MYIFSFTVTYISDDNVVIYFKQDLNRSALEFAKGVLSDNGCFLCKIWDGNETAGMSNFFSYNLHPALSSKARYTF